MLLHLRAGFTIGKDHHGVPRATRTRRTARLPSTLSPVPRFAGVLRDGNVLDSVVGMSGGPILGINGKGGGEWEYACVAVQGSWNRQERLLFGTPLSIVVDAVVGQLRA